MVLPGPLLAPQQTSASSMIPDTNHHITVTHNLSSLFLFQRPLRASLFGCFLCCSSLLSVYIYPPSPENSFLFLFFWFILNEICFPKNKRNPLESICLCLMIGCACCCSFRPPREEELSLPRQYALFLLGLSLSYARAIIWLLPNGTRWGKNQSGDENRRRWCMRKCEVLKVPSLLLSSFMGLAQRQQHHH